jgi:hypothetical protein
VLFEKFPTTENRVENDKIIVDRRQKLNAMRLRRAQSKGKRFSKHNIMSIGKIRVGTIQKIFGFQLVLSILWMINQRNVTKFKSSDESTKIGKPNFSSSTVSVPDAKEMKRTHLDHKTEWKPLDPWDPPPEGFYNDTDTGSFQNCVGSFTPNKNPTVPADKEQEVIISCHTIRYRAIPESFQKAGNVIVGVLSAAGGSGPERRSYIRSTWAFDVHGVFFLVGGPWKYIEREFNYHKDLIWIDEDEVYKGENSVLTYKTISYFNIAHKLAKRPEDGGFVHALKTDDDSYVNMKLLKEKVLGEDGKDLNYYGQCPQFQVAPLRNQTLKWPMSYGLYPEPKFPL